MQWIKEVELVDSVDELRSSSSIRGIQMPNFEVLDARIASALNRIIHNSHFKRRISLEGTKGPEAGSFSFVEDRSLTWSTNTSGSLESMILSRTTPTYSLTVYEMMTFRNSIRSGTEFLLSMTKIPLDDILEGLYKLRTRESEKLKTVLELYNMEIHQKKLGPDYHRLKTMVKRSIEQDIRKKNFGIRNGNYERNAVVKNSGTKQRVQRILGDCWQWETNGQCVKGDNCSFRHDTNKRAKMTQPNPSQNSFMQQNDRNASRTRSPRGRSPSGRMSRWPCKDDLGGTCINSFCEKLHPPECLFYKTKIGCRFGEKCSYAHGQVDEQPSKKVQKEWRHKCSSHVEEEWFARKRVATCCQPWQKSRKTGENRCQAWYLSWVGNKDLLSWVEIRTCWTSIIERTTIGLCFSRHEAAEVYLTEELRHAEANPTCEIHKGYCASFQKSRTKILRSDIFAQVNLINVAPTLQNLRIGLRRREWQEQGACEAAWKLARSVLEFKEHESATFFSPSENRCLPASTLKPEEREFVVDSGASMHMISKKDLSNAEMDTLTKSCSPTIVITANGEVQTHEEAIVYVKDLDIFLTMKVLENTPAVLSLGKLCDENAYSFEWINGQKPHLIKDGFRIICNTENFVPIVVPGLSSLSSGSSSTSRTPMKQESHSSSSSSSSPSSPTVGEIMVWEREDVPK